MLLLMMLIGRRSAGKGKKNRSRAQAGLTSSALLFHASTSLNKISC